MSTIRRYPVTIGLIAANIGAFVLFTAAGLQEAFIASYAFSAETLLTQPATAVISGFLHADVAHLFYNMLFLWVFGATCEEELDRWQTVLIYFTAMLAGGVLFAAVFPEESAIGASGAVAGLIAAGMLVAPGRPVHYTMPYIPIIVLAAAFIAPAALNAFSLAENVANIAHVGGAIAGGTLAWYWDSDRAKEGIWAVIGFTALMLGLLLL